jgi:hypothetical protein
MRDSRKWVGDAWYDASTEVDNGEPLFGMREKMPRPVIRQRSPGSVPGRSQGPVSVILRFTQTTTRQSNRDIASATILVPYRSGRIILVLITVMTGVPVLALC